MLKPPQHRIDASPVIILSQDEGEDAWDVDKIEAEKKEFPDAVHPVDAYLSGDTRYDLGAMLDHPSGGKCRVTDYLDLAKATQFVGRRLRHNEAYAVSSGRVGDRLGSMSSACRFALLRVEGPLGIKVERDAYGCSDATMQALFDLRFNLPVLLGEAFYLASLSLRPDEKKA